MRIEPAIPRETNAPTSKAVAKKRVRIPGAKIIPGTAARKAIVSAYTKTAPRD
jgi:hypothetical protein